MHRTLPLALACALAACSSTPPEERPRRSAEEARAAAEARAQRREELQRAAAAAADERAGLGEDPGEPPPAPPRPAGIPAPEDVSAPPEDAERTESGLATRVLEPGQGEEHPRPQDSVVVHYTGWRAEDGEMFDSSRQRGRPMTIPVGRVIPGWQEGLQLMVEGEQRRMWIPANLAYGENPGGGRPGGMLVFDVELIAIQRAPEPLPAPENVSRPPANAERSESGLAWIVLEEGEGERRPTATDAVVCHYTGWRAEDGEMFDSSVVRGEPITIPVGRVIPGWQEGLQLMVAGERRRFWIPANLAYGENPGGGRPGGMLVFDVQLLRIL